jgi:hypothetical protein
MLSSLVDAIKVTPLFTPVGGVRALLRSLRSRGQAFLLHYVTVIQTFLTRSLGLLRWILTRPLR